MRVFGYDDAPEGHTEVTFHNVRVSIAQSLVWQEGRGFAIIQGRLGPGRVHHCMRAIGMAERVLFKLVERTNSRQVFGRLLREYSDIQQRVGEERIAVEQCRLLVYHAAHALDTRGWDAKLCRKEIAMIKVAVPRMLCRLVDYAIQVYGAAGLGQDEILAEFYAGARTLRIADGPDAVHLMQIGKLELKSQGQNPFGASNKSHL
jgi:alkylation response protein AidB-like acyl-CoA dehydrogenase